MIVKTYFGELALTGEDRRYGMIKIIGQSYPIMI